MTQVIYGLNDPPIKLCGLDLSGIPSDAQAMSFFNLSGYAVMAAYVGQNGNWRIGAWNIKSGKFIVSGGYQELPAEPYLSDNLCTYGPHDFEYWPGLYGTRLLYTAPGYSVVKFLIPKPSPIVGAILQALLGIFAKIVNLLSAITQSSSLVPIDILAETFTGDIPAYSYVSGHAVNLFSTISNYADNYAAFGNASTGKYYYLNKNGIVSITSSTTAMIYQDDTGLYVYGTPNNTEGQISKIVNGAIVKQFSSPSLFGQNYYGNANNILVFTAFGQIYLYDTDGNSYPTTGLPDISSSGTCVGAGSGFIFFSDNDMYENNNIITKYSYVNGTWVKGASSSPIFVSSNAQVQMLYLRDGSSLLAIGSNLDTPYFMDLYLLAGPYTPYTLPVISGVNLHLNPLCPPCSDEEIF